MGLTFLFDWNGVQHEIDWTRARCLAIPLDHDSPQPNAWFAPLYEAQPHRAGDWIGDTRLGAPVNFFDIRLNPHGNGTHTECVGHISKERHAVHNAIANDFCVAQLISVYPTRIENGDKVIQPIELHDQIEALIIRTLPNETEKKSRQYGGANPAYLSVEFAKRIRDQGIRHLLLDLPSVDREEDGGRLNAHHAFWHFPEAPRSHATITEMIFVDNDIADGLYLLNIQIPAFMLDAAPSRPYIFPLE